MQEINGAKSSCGAHGAPTRICVARGSYLYVVSVIQDVYALFCGARLDWYFSHVACYVQRGGGRIRRPPVAGVVPTLRIRFRA